VLSVARNQLRTLPPQIGRCRALERVDASQNRLEIVPASIGQCRALRALDLHGNNLAAVPAALGQLNALESLHLQQNMIELLPPELAYCDSLKDVNCFDNPVRNVPAQSLTDIAMIRWMCGHNLHWQGRVAALEESSAELEDAARLSGEQRMLLQERVEMLEREMGLLEESTRNYRAFRKCWVATCPAALTCTIA